MDNAAAAFVDQPIAEGLGDETALVTPARRVTYAELSALVDRAGHALRARGVEPEQRVALLLPDGIGFAAAFFAAIKIGAVAVPLKTRLGSGDLRAVLADCRPKVLVADPDAARGGLEGLVASADALLSGPERGPLATEPVGLDAMAFWLYTSGTTGAPKAVVHAHRTLLAGRHYGGDVLGVARGDRVFATSKLFFPYALGNALVIPLLARANAYLHPAWPDPASVAAVMRS